MDHEGYRQDPPAFYLALFPGFSRDKPRFMALAEAVLRQAADLITLAQFLVPGFSFARAEGVQLDALGASVSIPRKSGWDDAVYRGVLLKKLKLYTWNGMNGTVPDYLEDGECLRDNGDNSVTAVTTGPLPARELLPVPMGVKVIE